MVLSARDLRDADVPEAFDVADGQCGRCVCAQTELPVRVVANRKQTVVCGESERERERVTNCRGVKVYRSYLTRIVCGTLHRQTVSAPLGRQ